MSTKSSSFIKQLIKPFNFSFSKGGRETEDLEKIAANEQKQFSFETLAQATRNFHTDQKLGQGGFGPVYKGKLKDGREIAVKKLSQTSNQGKREFMTEAKLLAQVQHRNVVNLLGYCLHGSEKILVYDYIPHESLDKFLFKSENQRRLLDWKKRFDIISGIAKGLLYLHEDSHECIIHRDIKASNILLDGKWVPKIADFGMARLYKEDKTHVQTRVAGTNGYMAPEYLLYGNLSVKADVFSYGVVVLELISGLKNSNFNLDPDSSNLLEWVYKLYKNSNSLEAMDKILTPSAIPEQVALCIQIGLLCTQSDPQLRPSMRRVVVMLSKKLGTIEQEPVAPGILGTRFSKGYKPNSTKEGSSVFSGNSSSTSNSNTNTSTHTNTNTVSTATTSLSGVANSRKDPHGKRPVSGH
ncbi:cysteine-rich receptor-like protein kinase 43 [Impatiens glandulifera]|uniref:cysteine-rich receptor-like protein kinase 43 n=1 Tax=Impatiens glandulifera TaxID=253017 RepID=UPI001FB0C2B8|nr:cysteine-rich receptor-like protein kinase 43 [Impatiens glandulifera]